MISKLFRVIPYMRKVVVLTGSRNLHTRLLKYKMGKALYTQLKNELPDKRDVASVYSDNQGRYVMWFKDRKVSNDTINHEVRHLIDFIFEYVGEHKTRELQAYYTEWLRKEIRKRL